jgi:hypothetical protein
MPVGVDVSTIFSEASSDLQNRLASMKIPGDDLRDTTFDGLGRLGFVTASTQTAVLGLTTSKAPREPSRSVSGDKIVLRGLFRSNGLSIEEIEQSIRNNLGNFPEHEISGPATESDVVSFRLKPSAAYSQILYFRPRLNLARPGDVIDGGKLLYALSFASTQIAQFASADALWLDPLETTLVFPWRANDIEASMWSFDKAFAKMLKQPGIEDADKPIYWEICNNKFRIISILPNSVCQPGAVGVLTNYPIFGSVERSLLFLIKLPFSPFLLSSFTITVVFYLSLFLFLIFGYLIKLIFYLMPRVFQDFVDVNLVRRHSISTIFVVGGFITSVLFGLLS